MDLLYSLSAYIIHVLFCKNYTSYYMLVGGDIYLIAFPHAIPHMVS